MGAFFALLSLYFIFRLLFLIHALYMRLFTTRDDVCKFFLMNSLTSVANKAARTSWRVIMWPLKGNSFASPIIKNKLKIHVVVPCPSDSKTFWSTSMELLYFPARIKSLSTCANFWLFQNFILVWQFWQKEIFPVSSFGATKDHKCCLASPCVRLQVVSGWWRHQNVNPKTPQGSIELKAFTFPCWVTPSSSIHYGDGTHDYWVIWGDFVEI